MKIQEVFRNSVIILSLTSGCTGPLAPRSPAEEFASPTKTALTETLNTSAVPTENIYPTITQTPTLEPTPTAEIAKPSKPNGLRPINAASETLENGTWVVKNNSGEVTSTWNAQKSEWDYSVENINVAFTFVGLKVDRSIIEPFLGPLPPDDPSTHFKNLETGEPAPYGIGPEYETETFGTGGRQKIPTTELFARFREIAPLGSYGEFVLILDVPHSIDKSTIVTLRAYDFFYIGYSPQDNMSITPETLMIVDKVGEDVIRSANQSFVGKQVMIRIMTDFSVGMPDDTFVTSDLYAEAFLEYFRNFSPLPPTSANVLGNIKTTPLIVPESQLP